MRLEGHVDKWLNVVGICRDGSRNVQINATQEALPQQIRNGENKTARSRGPGYA